MYCLGPQRHDLNSTLVGGPKEKLSLVNSALP
jgi:hypothetical protein